MITLSLFSELLKQCQGSPIAEHRRSNTKHSPAGQSGGVVLLAILLVTSRSHMAATVPYAAFDLDREEILRPRKVEAPTPRRRETILVFRFGQAGEVHQSRHRHHCGNSRTRSDTGHSDGSPPLRSFSLIPMLYSWFAASNSKRTLSGSDFGGKVAIS